MEYVDHTRQCAVWVPGWLRWDTILGRRAQVLDPELNESILDLGFVAINSTKPRDGWRQQLAEAVWGRDLPNGFPTDWWIKWM